DIPGPFGSLPRPRVETIVARRRIISGRETCSARVRAGVNNTSACAGGEAKIGRIIRNRTEAIEIARRVRVAVGSQWQPSVPDDGYQLVFLLRISRLPIVGIAVGHVLPHLRPQRLRDAIASVAFATMRPYLCRARKSH